MCMLTVFAWWCSYDCIRQCISFRSMSVGNSGLLVLLEWFFDAQCNSRWCNLLQSLHVALSITRFLEFTATGTGLGWQSDWIQQYNIRIFDAMVWTIHLCGHLSGQAYTYLHGQCNVDGCLGKRGYESTPVCAKPSYWMRRDDGEFIHEFTWKWTAYIE